MLIRKKVNKMTAIEAHKISLVRRSASRIPFRVVKSDKNQESGMFNLSRVFKNEADAPVIPTAVAVVVQKADASDALKAKLIEAGFEVGDVVENDDGTISYVAKGEVLDDKMAVVRQSDDVLVVVKGLDVKDLTAFSEIAKSEGFFLGVEGATNLLNDAVIAEIAKGEAPGTTASAIGTIVDAYRSYVVGMTASMPVLASKADSAVLVVKAEAEEAKESTPVVPAEKTPEEVAAEEAAAAEAASESATKVTIENKAPDTTVAVDKGDTETIFGNVLKTELDKFVQSLNSMREEIAAVRTQNEALQSSVTASVAKSEQLEAKLNGVVVGDAPNPDNPSGTTVSKTEEFTPLTDTAFMPRSRQYR